MIYKHPVRLSSNTSQLFKKSALAICIAAVTSQAYAQTSASDDAATADGPAVLEEVMVYGVKQSLMNAQDMKRDSDTFVDAISASDIGSLPDASVLEALQRVPGVTIERFAAPDDADHFSVEGSGATLRGLPQTRSEFNGRDTFSANSRRGLSFQDVSPELMGSVEVFKNQTADMIEGGIAGTVNLNTRKPFDSGQRQMAFTLKGMYGDFIEEVTPSLSGLYSNSWETEAGEFGLLLSYANTEIKSRTDGIEIGAHSQRLVDGVGNPFVPESGGIRSTSNDRTREGASLVLQWADPNEVVLTTFEYMGSKAEAIWLEHALYSDDKSADSGSAVGSDAVFTDDGSLFLRGTIENFSNLTGQTRKSDQTTTVEDYSLNIEINPTDRLKFEFDLQFVDANTDQVDLSVFSAVNANIFLDPYAGDLPTVEFRTPTSAGGSVTSPNAEQDAAYFADINNYDLRSKMDHIQDSDGTEKAFRFDLQYELEAGFAKSVEAGVRFAERNQTSRWANYNWGAIAEGWSGAGGYAGLDGFYDPETWDGDTTSTNAYLIDIPGGAPVGHQVSFDNFHRGTSSPVAFWAPNPVIVDSYENYLNSAGNVRYPRVDPVTKEITYVVAGDYPDLGEREGAIFGSPFLPAEINEIEENNRAIYLKLNFGLDDIRLNGNFGVRYVENTNSSNGGYTFQGIEEPNNPAAYNEVDEVTEELQDFSDAPDILGEAGSTFRKALPSFNVKWEVIDDVILRFAASESVSFADTGDLRFLYPVSADTSTVDPDGDGPNPPTERRFNYWKASTGNPFLKPMEAINVDLAAEWYFSDVGALTANVFYKDIKNFFANGTTLQSITNAAGTQDVQVSGPINQGNGQIKGLEIAYQQFFDFLPEPWDGLGVQANYTKLKESNVPNQNTRPVQPDIDGRTEIPFDNLPLAGLSEDAYNVVFMYEKDSFKTRLAYNWRSEYLLTLRHTNLGVPVYSEGGGQLDGSIFYDLTDNFEIGIEVANLLDEVTQTKIQIDEVGTKVGRSWFVNDRRFALVLKGSF